MAVGDEDSVNVESEAVELIDALAVEKKVRAATLVWDVKVIPTGSSTPFPFGVGRSSP